MQSLILAFGTAAALAGTLALAGGGVGGDAGASPSLPRLAVVLRIWAVFGEWYACNLLSTKDRVLEEWNVVP